MSVPPSLVDLNTPRVRYSNRTLSQDRLTAVEHDYRREYSWRQERFLPQTNDNTFVRFPLIQVHTGSVQAGPTAHLQRCDKTRDIVRLGDSNRSYCGSIVGHNHLSDPIVLFLGEQWRPEANRPGTFRRDLILDGGGDTYRSIHRNTAQPDLDIT
ncbi:hypothetical protein KM043_012678 [Ampulex compressa]|nr:hypothetical protein KM043_012678 [Ampulex compressa]